MAVGWAKTELEAKEETWDMGRMGVRRMREMGGWAKKGWAKKVTSWSAAAARQLVQHSTRM